MDSRTSGPDSAAGYGKGGAGGGRSALWNASVVCGFGGDGGSGRVFIYG
jgi:hypothetical protein